MLVATRLPLTPTAERLINLWTERYTPDTQNFSQDSRSTIRRELHKLSTKRERANTIAKFTERSMAQHCKIAAVRTKELYANLDDGMALQEAAHLAKSAAVIYMKLFEFYRSLTSADASLSALPDSTLNAANKTVGSALALASGGSILHLAETIEPLLLAFQAEHLKSKDWRTLGFITTQINFTNQLLLEQLTSLERIWLAPYFSFLEEQVALPWQRVCAVASAHNEQSPAFVAVEQLMAQSTQISRRVYRSLGRRFGSHYSRRGRFDTPAIEHSCLRDLDMFQAYLWLCLLQENQKPIEEELQPLCERVFESVRITPALVVSATQGLSREILQRLSPSQQALVSPYCETMVDTFSKDT